MNPHMLPMVAVLIYITINSVHGFFFPAFIMIVFWMTTILTGVRWNLSVTLICISLIAKDIEYFLCIY
jgi:hypothetical protein